MSIGDLVTARNLITAELDAIDIPKAVLYASGLQTAIGIIDQLIHDRYRPWFWCERCSYGTNNAPKAYVHETETSHPVHVQLGRDE